MLKISVRLLIIFSCLVLMACGSSNSNDLQPAIQISRTAGELPFHVYVSASDTLMDGVEHPYDQVSYSWDFGDSDSLHIFNHPVSNQPANANTDQQGPEASYVYDYADSYQITLTASYQRGDELLQESTSITVNASEWSGQTRYIDPDFGNDENDGASTEAPWQSWGAITGWLTAQDHRRALIKRGTLLQVDHSMNISTSNTRLGAYGEGERPELLATQILSNFIRLYPEASLEDHVYSDLTLNGNNGNVGSLVYSSLYKDTQAYKLNHLAFINMNFVNDDDHVLSENGSEIIKAKNFISLNNQFESRIEDVLVWGSNFERNHSFKNGIYAEMKKYLAVVGTSFSGGDGNAVKDHPIYPAGVNHALYRWLDFKETYSNNFSINNAAKDNKILQYTLVDGCSITGGRNGLDYTRHNADAMGWFSELIIQNNAFKNLGMPSQGYGIIGGSVKRITVRDNLFYGNIQSDIVVAKDGDIDVDLIISDNKMWKGNEPSDTGPMLDLQGIKTLTLSNNILVNEGFSGGSKLFFQFAIPEDREWQLDNNQYWAPDITSPFKVLADSNSYYDFTQWQAQGYDENSTNSDPIFINPIQGEF